MSSYFLLGERKRSTKKHEVHEQRPTLLRVPSWIAFPHRQGGTKAIADTILNCTAPTSCSIGFSLCARCGNNCRSCFQQKSSLSVPNSSPRIAPTPTVSG